MTEKRDRTTIPDKIISSKIYLIRDKKIMLDKDLALLDGVTTGNLNKAVKRNISRFSEDFMFRLGKDEFDDLIFQIGVATNFSICIYRTWGVAILSGVLSNEVAIKVNIQQDDRIMQIFEYLKQLEEIRKQELNQITKKQIGYK